MSYKFKEDVKRVLFEQQSVEQNPSVLNTAFNMRDELNEVYRKAEAFDDYRKHNLEYGKTYYEITREHIAHEMDCVLEKIEKEVSK